MPPNPKSEFLLRHPDFLIWGVCMTYCFRHEQLRKYKSILSWSTLASNHILKWDIAILDEFSDEFFDVELFVQEINLNESLPWSVDFIERYINLWDWELLAQNKKVTEDKTILNHFYNHLSQYIQEKEISDLTSNPDTIDHQKLMLEVAEFDNSIEKLHIEQQFLNQTKFTHEKSIHWNLLSMNTLVPWSVELIEKHLDKWDWQSIGFNEGIEWNESILAPFVHKLDKTEISLSYSAKWSLDYLIKFEEIWDYYALALNLIVWQQVFPEFLHEENLIPMLDLILERNIEPE